MGQDASTGRSAPEDGTDDAKQTDFDEEEVKRKFKSITEDDLNKAPEAFRQAYADDPKALSELERLVAEIEGGSSAGKASTQHLQEAAAAKKKAVAAERRTVRAADQEAIDWLKEQLRLHEQQEATQPKQKEGKKKEKKSQSLNGTFKHGAATLSSTTQPDKGAGSASPEVSLIAKAAPAIPKDAQEPAIEESLHAKEKGEGPHGEAVLGRWQSLGSLPTPQAPREISLDDTDPAPPTPCEAVPQPAPEFYVLLGVTIDATFEEIKRGYRKQALRWHPDKNRGQEAKAVERFKKINEAFDTLFDPEKRSEYDSGQPRLPGKAKRLQGHGWAQLADEDEATLTPKALKLKKQSWAEHVYFGGRVGDVDPVYEEHDPRTPQEKVRVFWRRVGEAAYEAREVAEGHGDGWLKQFVADTWKDTPSRWPSGLELQGMSETSQGEWQERRMVYNRRKMKVLLHIEAHEHYLATPDLEEKKKARLAKIWPGRIK
eukprot:TRINITY_DN32636_c0_g1_i1.p1 TRINITY_DN32636_c0_g1~~TRINITY_DN32636_c0_g1_i1.p1  ORF type:complete len:487 (-),score=150.75 TRINITY_DN32636_c0_g1_i1:49-1509(-)